MPWELLSCYSLCKMGSTIFYTLTSITVLYFLLAFLGKTIKKIVGKKICAICTAVSLTWLGLLSLWLIGFNIDPLIIAILMGQSVVGIMYQSEKYFKQKKLKKFWLVRILIITLGTLFVYLLLKKIWFPLLILIALAIPLTLMLWLVIFTEGGEEAKKTSKTFKKAVLDLEKMMEDCC